MVATVSVWLAVQASLPGLQLWADLVTGLSSASLFTGTLAAGFCAYQANEWAYANRYRVWSGVRSPAVARLHHALSVFTPLILGYCVALILLALYALIHRTYGSPSPAWLTSLGAAVLLSSAFGYSLGVTVGRRWFIAPGAAILYFALFLLSRGASLPFGAQSLFPAVNNTDSVFVRHLSSTLFGQTCFWIGSAVVLVLLLGGGWRRGSRRWVAIWVTLALAVTSAGAISVVTHNGQVTTGYNSRDFVCRSGSPTVCLNKGYANAMTPLFDRFASINYIAINTQLFATRLEQNVEGIGDEPLLGARSLYVEQLESDEDIGFAVFRYLAKYGGSSSCADSNSQSATATTYVDSWLSGFYYQLDGFPQPERLEALKRLSTFDGKAWFQSQAAKYFSCTLTFADLP